MSSRGRSALKRVFSSKSRPSSSRFGGSRRGSFGRLGGAAAAAAAAKKFSGRGGHHLKKKSGRGSLLKKVGGVAVAGLAGNRVTLDVSVQHENGQILSS